MKTEKKKESAVCYSGVYTAWSRYLPVNLEKYIRIVSASFGRKRKSQIGLIGWLFYSSGCLISGNLVSNDCWLSTSVSFRN